MSWRDDDKHVQAYRDNLERSLQSIKTIVDELETIRDQTRRILNESDKYSPRREKFEAINTKAENALSRIEYFKHLKIG